MPKCESSYTRLIVEKIKDWMKRHAGECPPGAKVMLADIELPEHFTYNYTVCKKQAYKELEKAGYILKKYSASQQAVASYRPPEGMGRKVAEKIVQNMYSAPMEETAEPIPQNVSESEIKKEIALTDKPRFHMYIKDLIPPEKLREIARSLIHLSKLKDEKLLVQIVVAERVRG